MSNKKSIIILFALPFVAAACVKTASSPENYSAPQVQTQPAYTNTGQDTAPQTKAPPENNPPKTPSQPSSISYKGVEGKSALELLKAKYQVQTKVYSGLGEFVESINGIKPDSAHFWEFYINGKSSTVGASSYVTKSEDNIEWKLSSINSGN